MMLLMAAGEAEAAGSSPCALGAYLAVAMPICSPLMSNLT